ncbi:MAG: RluA family pseudouridine synthase [Bacilli bacterium]|nr:RluA family pseudouridine synthase [Bacilli bacterium]MDD4298296.1 RluA family pseudouridine synthase [Bacilli bacterium]MDD4644231.1 RluA family pseudouridine synthase [Bacilli bacterium]
MVKIIDVNVDKADIRIDKYLIEELGFSRSKIQKLIKDNKVKVNGQEIKNSYLVRVDDEIMVEEIEEESTSIKPENIPLDILFEDDSIIVVNKPSGMVVHPAAGHHTNTLVNALLYHSLHLSNMDNDLRPGIIHRIDKDTSGLLVVAKNDEVYITLSQALKDRKVIRRYIALVEGVIPHDKGTIDAPIGRDPFDRKKMAVTDINAKDAITHFRVLKRLNGATLIECQLETGRTHQIRLHMQYIGYPIVNDPVYNNKKTINSFGQMLHAKLLGFNHPITNEYMEFEVDAPNEFQTIVERYR